MSDPPDDAPDLAALPSLETLEQNLEHLGALLQAADAAMEGEDDGLTRQGLEAGLRFIHGALGHARAQLSDVTASHEALLMFLAKQGVLDAEAFAAHREAAVTRELKRRSEQPDLHLEATPDKYTMDDAVDLDCLALLPLCKARCCRFHYALSEQDLDEGVLQWNYGQPYLLAQTTEGRCVHHGPDGRCQVFGARPAGCRRYDCRGDRRIWLDFDNRIPAPDR